MERSSLQRNSSQHRRETKPNFRLGSGTRLQTTGMQILKPTAQPNAKLVSTTTDNVKRPPLQMMPSLVKAQQKRMRSPQSFKLPRGLIVEFAILICAKIKTLLNFMRVCRLFRKECRQNNRLWYYLNSYLTQQRTISDYDYSLLSPMPDFYMLCLKEQK